MPRARAKDVASITWTAHANLAQLAVAQGRERSNGIVNAIGPETFTYRGLVERIGDIISARRPVVSVAPSLGYAAGWVIGKMMGDVFITRINPAGSALVFSSLLGGTGIDEGYYVAVDPGAPTYALAAAGLIALSYTLFLLFVIALQLASVRLFLSVPAIVVAAGLVTLRTLHLRLGGKWDFSWSVGVSIVTAQLAAGLHYWPLSPLQSGLILLGPLYGLTALAYSLSQDIPFRSAFAEPAIILGGLWAAAVFLR